MSEPRIPSGETTPVMSADDREALAIGREMQAALRRGRDLHPWNGSRAQLGAVHDEASELIDACVDMNGTLGAIYCEAVDCWVTARRLIEGV